jgi:signal peptidase II
MASICGPRRAMGQSRAGGPASGTARSALWWCAGLASLGLAADVAGKAWAESALRGGHRITAAGGLLRFQLVINHGASLGLGAGFEPVLALASLAGVVLLGFWAARGASRLERSGAAIAAAGAAGNFLDRLARSPAPLHGGVVDWIHVSFYGPTFNLADLWLRGGLLAAVGAWMWHHRRKPVDPPDPAVPQVR